MEINFTILQKTKYENKVKTKKKINFYDFLKVIKNVTIKF